MFDIVSKVNISPNNSITIPTDLFVYRFSLIIALDRFWALTVDSIVAGFSPQAETNYSGSQNVSQFITFVSTIVSRMSSVRLNTSTLHPPLLRPPVPMNMNASSLPDAENLPPCEPPFSVNASTPPSVPRVSHEDLILPSTCLHSLSSSILPECLFSCSVGW